MDHSMAKAGRRWRSLSWAAAALVVATMGCGGPVDPTKQAPTEGYLLRALVSEVGSAAVDPSPARFNSLFVAGSAPAEPQRAKYGSPLYFTMDEEPPISGDTVKLPVDVSRYSDDPNSSERTPVGKVEWTAGKEGAVWKLKDAPLP